MFMPSLGLSNASSQPFSEQLEGLSNEALYAALCTNRSFSTPAWNCSSTASVP